MLMEVGNKTADCDNNNNDKIMVAKDAVKSSLIQTSLPNLLQFSMAPSSSTPFAIPPQSLLPHAQHLSALIAAQQHQTALLAAAVAADRSPTTLMPPPMIPAQQQPQIIMSGVPPAGLVPTQILKVFTIPTPDGTGWQIVLQQEPTPAPAPTNSQQQQQQVSSDSTESKKSVQINPDRPFDNSSMPLKKRHRYENEADSTSSLSSSSSANDDNSRSSSNSPITVDVEEDESASGKTFRSPVIQANPQIRSSSDTAPKKRPYHHQPKDSIPEERLKNMTPEEVKRERNRLAADRCRKKKMAKIDDLSKEVHQMERQRRQVLFQLDSLRHAALSARDAVRSHKTAGCSIADEHGALARLIMEAEALDKFVKSQL